MKFVEHIARKLLPQQEKNEEMKEKIWRYEK